MWKVASIVIRAVMFVALAASVLFAPLVTNALSVFSDAASAAKAFVDILQSCLVDGFFPSFSVGAALVVLFPSWRVLRVGVPILAVATLVAWAALVWFIGFEKYPGVPLMQLRWSLAVASALSIVAAHILIFLLAKGRRPTVPPA